jgi:hypothetical protein
MQIPRERRGVADILDIDTLFATRLDHEDGVPKPGLLPVCHLALAVDIPDGRGQRLCHIGPFFHQGIPDCMCGRTARSTARLPGSAE